MRAIILAIVLFLTGCTTLDQVRDLALGPAATPATQVYRLAGGLLVITKRMEVEPDEAITARVKLANKRAYGAIKEAYAAVSMDNAPAELPRLIKEGATAIRLLAITAKIDGLRHELPTGTDPVSIGVWVIGQVIDVGGVAGVYQAELALLNESLTAMFLEERDPSQAEWDALWSAIAAGQAGLAAR